MTTRTMIRIAATVAVCGAAALASGSTEQRARPQSVRPADVRAGTLLLRTDVNGPAIPAPTVDTNVRIRVTGLVGRTRVVHALAMKVDPVEVGSVGVATPIGRE